MCARAFLSVCSCQFIIHFISLPARVSPVFAKNKKAPCKKESTEEASSRFSLREVLGSRSRPSRTINSMKVNSISSSPSLSQSPLEITMPLGGMREVGGGKWEGKMMEEDSSRRSWLWLGSWMERRMEGNGQMDGGGRSGR